MRGELGTHEQRALDMQTRPYQAARRVQRPLRGWLRKVRKTLGMQASGIAKDLKISPSMVFQLERSEWKETITFSSTLISPKSFIFWKVRAMPPAAIR